MQNQFVFQEKKELDRLGVQNRLLCAYEEPVFEQVFSAGAELAILDVGCNDGAKTIERFAADAVAKVLGLEYNSELARKAQEKYGNDKFSFYPFDVECEELSGALSALMADRDISGFDVVYLSFVLMHLRDPKRLLTALQQFLKPGGRLVIVEADDPASILSPDPDRLLPAFLNMLKRDKYSGNREVGGMLLTMLTDCGYDDVTVWHEYISAGAGDIEKKRDIFTTFFSYLPEDVALLRTADPDNDEYHAWSAWLDSHYEQLKQTIVQEASSISMGMKILSCMKGGK